MLWGRKNTPYLFLIFAAIVPLMPLMNAAAGGGGVGDGGGGGATSATVPNWYDNLYLWAGLSVAISATFLGLAYMAAKMLELQMLDAWVKVELQELGTSIVIAVFCVALIATVNAASAFLVGESKTTDIVSASYDFLSQTVYADGRELYRQLGQAYFNVAKVASYSYTIGVSIGVMSTSYSSSPASGLSPLAGEIGQGMDAVANFMLLAAAQASFLRFFGSAATVMLPAGIFLRSFSLTRKIGGVVLAAVIASAVVYPAAFFISKEVYSTYRADMMRSVSGISVSTPPNPPAAGLVCDPTMQRFVQSPLPFLGGEMGWWISTCTLPCLAFGPGYGGCMSTCYGVISSIFYIIKSTFPIILAPYLVNYASNIGASELISGYYNTLEAFAIPAVAKFSVLSLVVFLMPLIIAMVLLRSLAVTFGGEPQLYGISKLV